jgi:hypothetical protein
MVVCISIPGCDIAHETTWSSDSRSPDGNWQAFARTVRTSGPGNADVTTTVYLNWLKGAHPRGEILELDHDGQGSQTGIDLKMEWTKPSLLVVTYNGHATVNFQAVKMAGIDISLRDVSGGISDAPKENSPK